MPYYALLLDDDYGNICIKKSFKNYEIGDTIEFDSIESGVPQAKIQKKIAIIGTGLMGKQLTQFFSQNGYSVILYSRTEEGSVKAIKKIEKGLSKTKDPQEIKIITNRIDPSDELSRLKDAELIIESVIEDMEIKKQLFSDISSMCQKNAIIATNTSSLPITELATFVSNPERFIGMHFFNPVSKMQLVEIVYGQDTSKDTIEYVINLSNGLGKTPILVKDSPGFIVNRSLMPFINEAASLLQEGVSPNDIDNAIKLGLNHPMGPLALADLIGLDICVSIMKTLYKGFNDARYIPSPMFHELISKGHLGKKVGKGFYNYSI
ncbi:MAG: 3-hydroxyacyl-CoA dehydrogenase NAD-binding domain-containing protein [Methanothrix sp.]|nr:3-hydroxyacyl-CoA dehydrogenase NAD-binding domain-containing protein [Methanothrix sp.]MDD4409674.1 3-hydroxyacyl-CoA dehydrogenase NAD-binding domain-containing protein [Candidatus Paceibacterota bacterium]